MAEVASIQNFAFMPLELAAYLRQLKIVLALALLINFILAYQS